MDKNLDNPPYPFHRIDSIGKILKSDASYFFMDLEETIVSPNIFYDLIGVYPYSRFFDSLDVDNSNLFSLGKNYERILNEPIVPNVLHSLREQNRHIFALTSGFPSKNKEHKLKELNIYFEKILFTKAADKGPYLVKFLKLNNINHNCAFVDNTLDKIMNVWYHFSKAFPHRYIDLYLLEKQKPQAVNYEQFCNYWNRVLKVIKRY